MQDLKKEQDGGQKNFVVLFSSLIYERTDKYTWSLKRKKVYSFRNDEVYFKIIYSSEENHKNVLIVLFKIFLSKTKNSHSKASRFPETS